jgi:hypothetical protein
LLALYVFEASAVVAVLAFNRYYNLLDTLAVRQLAMVATPLVLALVSGAYVVVNLVRAAFVRSPLCHVCHRTESRRRPAGMRGKRGGGPGVLRVRAHRHWFGNTLLLPRDWEDVKARHRELLALVRDDLSYFVVDERSGGCPGAVAASKEGLYSTSTEGVRSASPAFHTPQRPPGPRIAIVGDSFTFGLEGPI